MTYPQQNSPHHRRAAHSSDSGGGFSKISMFGLIALALFSSVLMLFMDSDFWMKMAVLAALWAAFIGAVLVLRYSSALDSAKSEARRMDYTHRVELDRQKAEHRSREAQLAQEYRDRESLSRDEHIEALRNELVQMRMQLAKMSGRPLQQEQTAVQAHAERIHELDKGQDSTAARPTGPSAAATESARTGSPLNPTRNATNRHRDNAAAAHSRPSAPKRSAGFNTGTFAAVQWSGQDAEETTQIPLIVDTYSMDQHNKAEAQKLAAADGVHGAHEHRAQDAAPDGEGGRRRADDGKLTVAELMKRFKK